SVAEDIDQCLTDDDKVTLERQVTSTENKRGGRKGAMALKVNMSKAYDRVEWLFIQAVLAKFCFPSHFSNLIMACVSSVSFAFNINGKVSGHVTPTRGLRQGDPISPYLFIMCAEALSSMIRKAVTCGYIHGVKVCRGAPEISHLFFADDSIFFTRASVEECYKLKGMLERYCKASGQVINYEKSKISFSTNVDPSTRTRIIESLEVHEVANQSKYLGLPSIIGRSKKLVFQAILDKIKKKLSGWKEKTLSIGGNEVLIKSVAQAIPMYVMNIFLLLDTLINDIHKALNLFWWSDGVKQNPIRWCSWEKMCVSKFRGGLGFRHLGLFNKSLLAKQLWRLITSPNTLAARVLKACYFPRSTFFEANVGYHPSYIWRSFHGVKELVRKGCKWNIGDGHNVNVWEDYWLEDHTSLGRNPHNCEVIYVRDLLNADGDDWNSELLISLFPNNIANKISCCFVNQSRPDTHYFTVNSPVGLFQVKWLIIFALDQSMK
ncbi:reverse transcriptase, partial [Tanacetum coccineum]